MSSKDYDPEFVESTGYGQDPEKPQRVEYYVALGVNEDSAFYENLYIRKNLYVKGDVEIKKKLYVKEDMFGGQNLYIEGNGNIKMNLAVGGIVTASGFFIGNTSFFSPNLFRIGVPTEAIRGFASTAGTRLTGGTVADKIKTDTSEIRDLFVADEGTNQFQQFFPTRIGLPIYGDSENDIIGRRYVTVLASVSDEFDD